MLVDTKNKIIIKNVSGRSRLATSLVTTPLKVFNPDSHSDWCHLVLSNHGGGFLSGDDINIDIHCEANSRMYLGTQGNTRVYKQTEGKVSRQTITGYVKEGAMAVIAPDPTVLHEDSHFQSRQKWYLDGDANLVLTDWMVSGRLECDESFLYGAYSSEIGIERDSELILLDRLDSIPGELEPSSMGRFGPYQTFLNVIVVGKKVGCVIDELRACCDFEEKRRLRDLVRDPQEEAGYLDRFCSLSEFAQDAYLFKALGKHKQDLDEYYHLVLKLLIKHGVLGFDPVRRKY